MRSIIDESTDKSLGINHRDNIWETENLNQTNIYKKKHDDPIKTPGRIRVLKIQNNTRKRFDKRNIRIEEDRKKIRRWGRFRDRGKGSLNEREKMDGCDFGGFRFFNP